MTYPRWWVRLTTPALLSWRVVLAVFLLGTLAYVVGNEQLLAASPPLAMAAAIAGNAVVVGAMALGRLLFGSITRLGVAGLISLLSIAVGSALRGVFLHWFHDFVGLPDEQAVTVRVITSFLTLGALTVILVIVVDALDDHRITTHRINLLRATEKSLSSFAEAHTNAFTANTISGVTQAITTVSNRLSTPSALSDPQTVVDELKRVTNDVVRPLSKQLDLPTEPLPEPPPPASLLARIDWRQLARDATTGTPYSPLLTGIFMAVMVSGGLLAGAGPTRGVPLLIGAGGGIALALWAQNLVISRFPERWSVTRRFAVMVVMATVMTWVFFALFVVAVGDTFPLARIALNLLVGLPIVMVMFALRKAAVIRFARAEKEQETLRRDVDWEKARANDVFWHRRRTLATVIHGPVQATLNAAVLKLQQDIDNDTFSQKTLDRIRVGLGEALTELDTATDTTTNLQLALDRIASTWEGLCEVTWDVDQKLIEALSNSPQSSAIADILIEATFNAVRHGGATAVHITMVEPHPTDSGPQVLTLRVTNNGAAPNPSHTHGQGSKLFDMLTTDWRLTTSPDTPGEVVCEAMLPLGKIAPR